MVESESVKLTNTKIVLKSNPTEFFKLKEHFETVTGEEEFKLTQGQVLVEIKFVSFDASQRVMLTGKKLFYMPEELTPGKTVMAICIGVVTKSKSQKYKEGQWVSGIMNWSTYGVYHESALTPEIESHPLNQYRMGWMTYLTAYFGLTKVGLVDGEVNTKREKPLNVLVSTAAGATGSSAAQLAKAWGCNVVGIAGGADKCEKFSKKLGIPMLDYKKNEGKDLAAEIKQALPNGIDVYYDNVGSWMLDIVFDQINMFGRIISCGMVSNYNDSNVHFKNFFNIISRRVTISGFIVMDYISESPKALDVAQNLIKEGKFEFIMDKNVGPITDCPRLIEEFFLGQNTGKFFLEVTK